MSQITADLDGADRRLNEFHSDLPAKEITIEEFLANEQGKDLLRFSTAGSVDDGKSTLIGRLLYDSRNVYEDHVRAVTRSHATGSGTGAAAIEDRKSVV